MQYRHSHHRPGSAMVLAIVSVMLLFIIGMSFIVSTKTEKDVTDAIDSRAVLDDAVKTVIEDIRTVLVQDLVGTSPTTNLLDNTTGESNEPYDYPGTEDPWLASLEPEMHSGGYYVWRQITDLYNDQFNISTVNGPQTHYDPEDRTVTGQWDGSALSAWYRFYGVTNLTNMPLIRLDDTGTEMIRENGNWNDLDDICLWGARADADGDGVADSRWALVPNLSGPQGENLYTAVRIIDNCAMVNLNTAYGVPSATTEWDNTTPIAAADWDGSHLTDINIETDNTANIFGINAISDSGALRDFQKARCQSDDINGDGYPDVSLDPTAYNDNVAMQILNTNDHGATTFGISEELELRNRYFLSSPVETRLGGHYFNGANYNNILWETTFDPDAGTVGKGLPYVPGDDLSIWYDKVTCDWTPTTPDVGYYNRRKISTTYSFDRVICPETVSGSPFTDGTDTMPSGTPSLSSAWETWSNWNAGINKNYSRIDVKDVINGTQPAELLAAAIWLGLPQNTVLDIYQDVIDLGWVGSDPRTRVACQMAVNIIDYYDVDTISTSITANSETFFGYESAGEHLYIARLGVSYYNNTGSLATHYAITLYNPGIADINITNWVIDVNGTSYTISSGTVPAGDVCVLIDADNTQGFELSEFSQSGEAASFSYADTNLISLLDSNGRPCDSVTANNFPAAPALGTLPGELPPGEREIHVTNDRVAYRHIGPITDQVLVWENSLDTWTTTSPAPSGTTGNLELESTPPGSSVTAAIFVTSLDLGTTNLRNIGELTNVPFIGSMNFGAGSYQTVSDCWDSFFNASNDIPATASVATARIDAGQSLFSNFFNYITLTEFSPYTDSLDNNGDGNTDETGEIMIPGRININTAPWFVIAQLPWIQDVATLANGSPEKFKLARAVTAYRDLVDLSALFAPVTAPDYTDRIAATGITGLNTAPGFTSIGELTNVTNTLSGPGDEYYDIRRYGDNSAQDLATSAPFYYTGTIPASIQDSIQERDVIFHRISNLATVRSDVFTAYIAVRLGEQGPIKRVIAILDRSNVYSASDSPRIIALHEVPMPQ